MRTSKPFFSATRRKSTNKGRAVRCPSHGKTTTRPFQRHHYFRCVCHLSSLLSTKSARKTACCTVVITGSSMYDLKLEYTGLTVTYRYLSIIHPSMHHVCKTECRRCARWASVSVVLGRCRCLLSGTTYTTFLYNATAAVRHSGCAYHTFAVCAVGVPSLGPSGTTVSIGFSWVGRCVHANHTRGGRALGSSLNPRPTNDRETKYLISYENRTSTCRPVVYVVRTK